MNRLHWLGFESVSELGIAVVWFVFYFDFVGCRDFDFFVLEDDFGFQLIKISLGTKF